MLSYKFPVAKIYNVYAKGEMLEGYVVLEEEKIEGEIYYKKIVLQAIYCKYYDCFGKLRYHCL